MSTQAQRDLDRYEVRCQVWRCARLEERAEALKDLEDELHEQREVPHALSKWHVYWNFFKMAIVEICVSP